MKKKKRGHAEKMKLPTKLLKSINKLIENNGFSKLIPFLTVNFFLLLNKLLKLISSII